jgi:polysaccharide export outer membrane protein
MWRNTTVKSRLILRRATMLLLIVVQAAVMAAPALTQDASLGSTMTMKSGAGGQVSAPVVLPGDFSQLRIEPGDLLNVNVYDTPELTNAYRVDPAGELTLPLCGKVRVQGLNLQEIATLLEATLKNDQVLIRPQVNVDLLQYAGKYVTVLGEVSNPGRVMLIAPTKLSEILAQSGGLTPLAGTRIKIRRGADADSPEEQVPYSRSESNRETGSLVIRPGDTVIVPRTGIVYVLGAVNRPGGYVMQEDGKLNVAEALALSGGTALQAKTNGLRVIRRNTDGTVLDISLSYDGIAKGTQKPLDLKAQDIVYVPISKVKAVFADATGILSSATSAAIYTVR